MSKKMFDALVSSQMCLISTLDMEQFHLKVLLSWSNCFVNKLSTGLIMIGTAWQKFPMLSGWDPRIKLAIDYGVVTKFEQPITRS